MYSISNGNFCKCMDMNGPSPTGYKDTPPLMVLINPNLENVKCYDEICVTALCLWTAWDTSKIVGQQILGRKTKQSLECHLMNCSTFCDGSILDRSYVQLSNKIFIYVKIINKQLKLTNIIKRSDIGQYELATLWWTVFQDYIIALHSPCTWSMEFFQPQEQRNSYFSQVLSLLA